MNWNGAALSTGFTDSGQLTAAVPVILIASAVTVTSGSLTSAPVNFAVLPGPTITSLSPPAVTPGGTAFPLTVNGSGFANGATVKWNGAPLPTTFGNVGQLTAAVSAKLIGAVGTATIDCEAPAWRWSLTRANEQGPAIRPRY